MIKQEKFLKALDKTMTDLDKSFHHFCLLLDISRPQKRKQKAPGITKTNANFKFITSLLMLINFFSFLKVFLMVT